MRLSTTSFVYPEKPADRSRWVLSRRGPKDPVDPLRPFAFFLEHERDAAGEVVPTATIFLTNRECPWRCVMCDLWKKTTDERVPPGAIPAQIQFALTQLPPAREVKLYNSGSFFDPNAIPPEDLPKIADLVRDFERVIVECHPSLVGRKCADFQRLINGQFEVAMGLETAHPQTLEKLNKGMSLDDFAAAAGFLRDAKIDLRVFTLVNPPFLDDTAAPEWVRRSIDFAAAAGATVISLIPTRLGNGALDELAEQGNFREPTLKMLEDAHACGIDLGGPRVFADLWDLRRFSRCLECFEARHERLHRMNLEQRLTPRVVCACGT